jgi:uncharacterized lipoprotein YajG
MKYLFLILMITSLSACQTATQLQNVYSKGLASSYSCEQINAAFSAYEMDKTSFKELAKIAEMSGLVIEQGTKANASSYYENVKSAANVALMVQGCPPRD